MTAHVDAPPAARPPGSAARPDAPRVAEDAPDLSIIVVSWNTREMTLACLGSVYAETRETRFELLVVDNDSTDGSADAIAAQFPQARLIRSPTNAGFARANNFAAAEARAPLLLLLNPDTVVLDGAIDALVAFSRRRPEARIWGGRTVFADGSLNAASCLRDMDLWGLLCRVSGCAHFFPRSAILNPELYGGWARDDERGVDIVVGCFLLIETALWRDLGGFDRAYVTYGEEADLCWRARTRFGARPRITPAATIIHHQGASQTVRADKMNRLLAGRMTLIRRTWSPLLRPIGARLLAAWPWTRALAARLRSRAGRGSSQGAMWEEVWRRRAEWRHGFAVVASEPDRAGASARQP
jgi:GT2 family glycosyltransferase